MAVLTPTLGPPIVTVGVVVYWLPLLIIVIDEIASSSTVAYAVQVSPLGPVGASTVTEGVDVYPVPPALTAIEVTFLYKVSK